MNSEPHLWYDSATKKYYPSFESYAERANGLAFSADFLDEAVKRFHISLPAFKKEGR